MSLETRVVVHYASGGTGATDERRQTDLGRRILDLLAQTGCDLEPGFDAFPPVDELHLRGREASLQLAHRADLRPGIEVLDAGCGLGGSSRMLHALYGCSVTGIDLTPQFCRAARTLSEALSLQPGTHFVCASGTSLPFSSARFEVVWTQHAQMNIADKDQFYGELCRVLRPGGQLLFHDIFAGDAGRISYPLPWAPDASISALTTPAWVAGTLRRRGMQQVYSEDCTEASIAWIERTMEQGAAGPEGPVRRMIMGPDGPEKMTNLLRALKQGALVVLQARWDRTGTGQPAGPAR